MSECVVRMEMPKSCYNCDLRYECNAFYAPGKPKPFMKGCRIVCQLTEGHGRLVDAGAKIYVMQVPVTVDDASWIVHALPTIVPAEAESPSPKPTDPAPIRDVYYVMTECDAKTGTVKYEPRERKEV